METGWKRRFAVALFVLGFGGAMPGLGAGDAFAGNGAQHRASPFMRLYGETRAPSGFVGFCDRYPGECRSTVQTNRRIHLTNERWRELDRINRLVNTMIEPVSDRDLYGRAEVWVYPKRRGDCEDYVLLKRRMLMQRGWPKSALLITVARDQFGEGHAVLIIRTAEGDFVIDNKNETIAAWYETPYQFVKRQSSRDQTRWMSLLAAKSRPVVSRVWSR